ncbi:MAG: hypothetical protein EOM90_16765 [Alphaproteobacteria bacterium]|nr:hypothetical protein [Alphaproteobacteria bacterium]
MSISRRLVNCNLNIAEGNTYTPYIQIPNGATNITIQFVYSGLDANISCTMQQSLDGSNFDSCANSDDIPVCIELDHTAPSMTMNVTDLLTTWIRFYVEVGDATVGSLDKLYILFS